MAPQAHTLTARQQDLLRSCYLDDATARVILEHLATQKHNAEQTTVDSLEALRGTSGRLERGQISRFFRRLAKEGLGDYQVARRGIPSSFVWRVPSLKAAQLATGLTGAESPPAEAARTQAPQATDPPATSQGGICHQYVLRPNFRVEFNLPSDLSHLEAQRLARFIETLPMMAPEPEPEPPSPNAPPEPDHNGDS